MFFLTTLHKNEGSNMTLFHKIKTLYPELQIDDFGNRGTIRLRNDSDGRGDYIEKWEHPTLVQPTEEQLDGISSSIIE